jgi:hypothetical protein
LTDGDACWTPAEDLHRIDAGSRVRLADGSKGYVTERGPSRDGTLRIELDRQYRTDSETSRNVGVEKIEVMR